MLMVLSKIGSLKKKSTFRGNNEDSEFHFETISSIRLKPLTAWIITNCGKLLKRWEYRPSYCLLRILFAGQEATVRTQYGTTD